MLTLKNIWRLIYVMGWKHTDLLEETARALWFSRNSCLYTNTRYVLQIAGLIADATKDLRLEVASLQEKLRESHARYTEESESKKKEIEDLKNMVAEFECRLKKETGHDDSVSEELKKEMKQKSDELERVRLAQTQLLQQFSQSQEEVGSR